MQRRTYIAISVIGWLVGNMLFELWRPDGNRITNPPGPELVHDGRVILYPLHYVIDFSVKSFLHAIADKSGWGWAFYWEIVLLFDRIVLVTFMSIAAYFIFAVAKHTLAEKSENSSCEALRSYWKIMQAMRFDMLYVSYCALILCLLSACWEFWIDPPGSWFHVP